MRMSAEEAMQLLDKYIAERTLLLAGFVSTEGFIFVKLTGVLIAGDKALQIVSGAGDSVSFITIGCVFEYVDAREAPEFLQGELAEQFESCLTLTFMSSQGTMHIFERRA